MKILKRIIGVLIAIIGILLIVALFAKKEYTVEREITIKQPVNVVFNYVKHLKNQDKFSVWQLMDPEMKKEYKGTDGTVGFISAWDSENKNVGKGEQEITKITEEERIDFELRFFAPWEAISPAYMTTESVADSSTLLKWGFHGRMDYPMNLMLVFMDMEEQLGTQLQEGLVNLREILE